MLCSICNTMFCNTKPSTCYKFALADAVMATLFLFGSELLMPGADVCRVTGRLICESGKCDQTCTCRFL